MNGLAIVFTTLAVLAGTVLAVFLMVYLVVPVLKGIGWLIRHVFRFFAGMVTDVCRFIGSLVLSVLYVPMVLGNIVIGRWSASGHYGRAFMNEVSAMGLALYRVGIGHPARLFGLGGMLEGVENRLPAVVAGAPTADIPGPRTGQFEGYRIIGSLAAGGSGAKLYIAEPDSVKRQQLAKAGVEPVGQVVIKSFSLQEGSSLPQIVRESRSLDAAKRLGLIFDHQLAPDRFYYVMKYVPGESLSSVAKNLHAGSGAGGLDDAQMRSALSYVSDLVATLDAYHRGGLWHKDVKPDNVIIDRDGRAHLVDFGLVSSLRSAMTLTTHGTEYFRDPEMVRLALRGVKVHEVDGTKFDIYGAGAVLYSIIEDSFPAHGALSQVTRRCPESVKWIIRRAMTDYDKRYVSAGAMLADLSTVLNANDAFAVRPADLPSMRGAFAPVSGDEPAPVAAASAPTPGGGVGVGAAAAAAGAAAMGAVPPPLKGTSRTAPVIQVTDWWSGKSRVVGSRATPNVADDAAQAARSVVEQDINAAKGVFAGIAGSPAPVAQRAVHTPAPGPRRPAHEQLSAARARVEARRERTRAYRAKPIGARSTGKGGWNGGVAAALLVFVGALIGLGITLGSERSARSHSDGEATVAVTVGEDGGSMAKFDHGVGPIHHVDVADDVADPEEPIPQVQGSVLLVSDLGAPMSPEALRRASDIADALHGIGLSTSAVTPGADSEEGDQTIALIASLRASVGLTPLDDSVAGSRIVEWIGQRRDDVDLVVWLAPNPNKDIAEPMVYVFAPAHDDEDQERAESVREALRRSALRAE